jgi:hypothetical protein
MTDATKQPTQSNKPTKQPTKQKQHIWMTEATKQPTKHQVIKQAYGMIVAKNTN